ncbi:carboxynorspermidine decarboxylase [Bacillus massiliigorillae]|uniref:carboxynorspermidine decarboxylase n=1 Tax=Bacillus massiliigorillae TaxID=1243664 RepID=UPI0003A5F67E|nr:carboxynorspermidine decarboxylase [Bacillus massiliigorillae]
MGFEELPTPCYVVDEELLEKNLKILNGVMERTGCKILLAQKAFSMYATYPLISKYLSGTAASGLYEARLGYEEMGKENHVFSPAYREDEIDEILAISDHIVFNSFSQLEKFGEKAQQAGKSIGVRINPECSTQVGHGMYDPCVAGSRFGVTLKHFRPDMLHMISGLHFHTLCEQGADALATTLDAVEEKFGQYLHELEWINLGGGHHITKEGYDIPLLEACIKRMQETYGLVVYLEPGEAIALNAGFLVTTVLDTLQNEMDIAIVDTSASCHMPDVLEVPYLPPLLGSCEVNEKPYTYRLGGPTCLTGDVIGDYSFDKPLESGDRLVFGDMAIYSMVKNNTFNGMALPAIAIKDKSGDCRIVRSFGYQDFKERLS